jgi:hypothetical protein
MPRLSREYLSQPSTIGHRKELNRCVSWHVDTSGCRDNRSCSHVVPLRGLGQPDVAACIEHILGAPPSAELARTVHDATLGNPFYVDSLVRLLAARLLRGLLGALGGLLGDLLAALHRLLARLLGLFFDLVGDRPELVVLDPRARDEQPGDEADRCGADGEAGEKQDGAAGTGESPARNLEHLGLGWGRQLGDRQTRPGERSRDVGSVEAERRRQWNRRNRKVRASRR